MGKDPDVARDGPNHACAQNQRFPWEPAVDAVVVYESVFGNTRKIAEAIGEGWTYLGSTESRW